MNCPSCEAKVGFKACLIANSRGFICPSCKASLIASQSSAMVRYLIYLIILLFLEYYFKVSLVGLLLFVVFIGCFDLIFITKLKVTDNK